MAHCIYQSYNFWIAKNTGGLTIFGINFSSIWVFWLFGLVVATPVLSLANVMFSGSFYFGYRHYNNAWLILLTFIGAQTLAYPIMVYFWFREIPSKGTLLGALFALAGLLIANFWRD